MNLHGYSETEVILKAFIHYGYDIFKEFNGNFSIGIWNENKKELILCRDHFGIKPLYYTIFDNTLIAPIGNGGLFGALIYGLFSGLFEYIGTIIMTIMFILIGLLMFREPLKKVFGFANDKVQITRSKYAVKKEKKKPPAAFPQWEACHKSVFRSEPVVGDQRGKAPL